MMSLQRRLTQIARPQLRIAGIAEREHRGGASRRSSTDPRARDDVA